MLTSIKKKSKIIVMSMTISILTVLSSIAVGAEEVTSNSASLQDAFSSSLSTIQSDVLGMVALALPVGLAVFGAFIAIKKGIAFVKSLLGKA